MLLFFLFIFNQLNAAFVSIRKFFQKHLTDPTFLNGNVEEKTNIDAAQMRSPETYRSVTLA